MRAILLRAFLGCLAGVVADFALLWTHSPWASVSPPLSVPFQELWTGHDKTFRKSHRLQRQLDYAQSLGLGEQSIRQMDVVEARA